MQLLPPSISFDHAPNKKAVFNVSCMSTGTTGSLPKDFSHFLHVGDAFLRPPLGIV